MRIALVEPFYAGSHKVWADEFLKYSTHEVRLFTLEGRYWKWRMHGGAVSLAKKILEAEWEPDVILATDMLDLSVFLSLIRSKSPNVKAVVYFHENQLNYPWSPTDQDPKLNRDNHYAFINFTTALAADVVLFNSAYHHDAFLDELPKFLKGFPDYPELWAIDAIRSKAKVLPLGMDLSVLDAKKPKLTSNKKPLLLWNHRWEYDKNPEDFFKVLIDLSDEGLEFDLAVLGEHYRKYPPIFDKAREHLESHIVHWGYTANFFSYVEWLWKADILPVTSKHDFFGASVVQAIYCETVPLLPNRLAYPEHLPEGLQKSYLYEHTELKDRLRTMLELKHQDMSAFVRHISQYDWSNCISKYDEVFDGL